MNLRVLALDPVFFHRVLCAFSDPIFLEKVEIIVYLFQFVNGNAFCSFDFDFFFLLFAGLSESKGRRLSDFLFHLDLSENFADSWR